MEKKSFDWRVSFFILLFIAVLFVRDFDAADKTPLLAPLNPDFVKYIESVKKGIPLTPADFPGWVQPALPTGANPPPVDLSHISGVKDEQINDVFPPYYDLRNENKLTSRIRGQEGYSCWSHAVYNSLHSYLMPGEDRDFDAEHMDKYWNHGFTQPLGGDYRMATACLARWTGPVEAPDEMYTYWRVGKPGDVQKHVQQVVYLPKRNGPLDNNTTKWFIMNHGAVYASLRFDGVYYNYDTETHYYTGNQVTNHAFALVGWDDHFDRTKFQRTPPGDGAFIGRMAWGENFGYGGYFYVSYYDTVLSPDASFNNAEDVENYGTIYQYDPLGAIASIGRADTVYWGANVFTAENDLPLEAVSFYTNDADVSYDIYTYKNTGASPVDGTLAALQTGNKTYAGYYTVKLNTRVPLNTGERFSVVIRFENSSHGFPVPIEKRIEHYSHKAGANPGESYISSGGTYWDDLTVYHPHSNVCIKAFSAAPKVTKPVIRFQARKETAGVWLIRKIYGVLTFTIENLDEIPVTPRVTIYRKQDDGKYYTQLYTVSFSGHENGSFTYYDQFLEEDRTYIYHVTVSGPDGAILGRSPDMTVL
ncbi:MAG: surface layer protein B [bacterium]|nr:surface layer protein B [bacterium]